MQPWVWLTPVLMITQLKINLSHLSVIRCSDSSKSLTVNSIADRTDCGTLGVGDKFLAYLLGPR